MLWVATRRGSVAPFAAGIVVGATTFGAGANVVANLVLIPRAGIEGAAWATVGTYVLLYVLYRAFLDPEKR